MDAKAAAFNETQDCRGIT